MLMVGCTEKGSQNRSDIPDDQVINHSDSLVFAARKTGDFNRVLAVIDSLADAGDFSPIHADNYRCEPYFGIHQPDEAEKWVNREDSILAIYRQNPEADSTEIEVFRAYILLDRAKICQARGQKDQAERYYAEYTQTARGKEIQGYLFGGHYLMQAHRYADAADVYQQLDHYLGSYGFDYNLEIIGDELIPKFNANYYAGRKDSALQVALKIACAT